MRRRDFLRYGAIGVAATTAPGIARGVAARPAGSLDVVSCAIHPAIGVTRVGNSPDAYFIGPEVPGRHPIPPDGFKDAAGRIKRQAARFRVFGLDADGNVVAELTAAEAEIEWTVHLANKKAAWYAFDQPLDIPEAQGYPPATAPLQNPRRNAGIGDRGRLAIDPGPRSIAGRSVNSGGGDPAYAFDTGRFFDRPVPLGDLRTDATGRLLVLGGFGSSAPVTPGQVATEVSNNDGWHDDVSDGPVDARVWIGDREVPVSGAWVVVAPPNFAPGIPSVVTMYDVVFEVATRLEPDRAPVRPSFTRQIYPLFERHHLNQWVNTGMARQFGWGTPGNFLAPTTLARLADPSEDSRFLRDQVFQCFRDPSFAVPDGDALPPYYGDDTTFPGRGPRQWMAVLPIQYEWLGRWAAGDFDADWPRGGLRRPARLEDFPIADRPGALDRAALDECLGGPFHPGIELTWPMRVPLLYAEPFRIRRRSGPEPDWGDLLNQAIALAPNGPLSAGGPGDLTKWMGLPWQTDTASCLSAYVPEEGEFLPTFWPARVPNDVLPWASYETIRDPSAEATAKLAAFANRVKWLRGLPGRQTGEDHQAQIARYYDTFLRTWGAHGIVAELPGPPGDRAFPPQIWVETGFAVPPPPNQPIQITVSPPSETPNSDHSGTPNPDHGEGGGR